AAGAIKTSSAIALQSGSLPDSAEDLNGNATVGIILDQSYATTNIDEIDVDYDPTGQQTDGLPQGAVRCLFKSGRLAGYSTTAQHWLGYESQYNGGNVRWIVSRALSPTIQPQHLPKD